MRDVQPAGAIARAEKLYRLLLFVYPAAHRREYGPLMVQAFRDLGRDSYHRQGVVGLAALWIRIVVDLAVSSVTEHLDAWREGGTMTRKQHSLAIISAALPLVLWLVLGAINPGFAGHLFSRSPVQPLGWLMAAAIPILAALAYVGQRQGLKAGNTNVGLMARMGSVALFVLPAIALVVLGPAIMMVLEL